jgi:dipeptidyl aminopeptidase/acylaminoacyl peptidase
LLAFVAESAVDAPELWLSNGEAAAEKVTRFNESWSQIPVLKPEVLRYKSFDGTEIEAMLLKPRGYVEGTRVATVVLIHGGPTGVWSDSFEPWGQLLAARGYAVLYPNIRGSIGYGHRFIEMNRGDWGGADFKDVMSGVDFLISRGIADPNRLGIGGWSYGGYMSEWAITQTQRFKAAVSGAGMSDLATEFGTEDGPAYDEWFYGLPYEKPEGFAKSSPMTYVKNARTPTLILHGENDRTDPIGQSQMLYRALKRYGVESEFVVYPREPHGLQEEKHLIDRMNRIVRWFDAHLK